ncbi:hypothetical protein OSTOST_12962, partial [Ostertagia ostertagi]
MGDDPSPETAPRYEGVEKAVVAEAQRIAHKYDPPLPVYAYTKVEYDPRKLICSFYTAKDLCNTIILPYVMGVNGLIFWSSSNNMTDRCGSITTFLNMTLGPLVRDVSRGRYGEWTKDYNE